MPIFKEMRTKLKVILSVRFVSFLFERNFTLKGLVLGRGIIHAIPEIEGCVEGE